MRVNTILLGLLLFLGTLVYGQSDPTPQPPPSAPEVGIDPDSVFWDNLVAVKVLAVHDGDSYKVSFGPDTSPQWIRLIGIDAPELMSPWVYLEQDFARASGDSLRNLLKGDTIFIDTLALKTGSRDVYGRLLADVYLKDLRYLPLLIAEKGWGWARYVKGRENPRVNQILLDAMYEARLNHLGLWGIKTGKFDASGKPLYKRPILPETHRGKYRRSVSTKANKD